MSAGNHHGLAVVGGHVWAWGLNSYTQLADPSHGYRNTPQQIQNSALSSVTSVAAGQAHSLALRADGTVWGWGDNGGGQVGTGDTAYEQPVSQTIGITDATAIAAGANHSLAIRANGTVLAWGSDINGQLGDGGHGDYALQRLPVPVAGLTQVVKVAAGTDFNVAVRSDGTVWTWGHNNRGQLGDNTTIDRSIPVKVGGLDHVIDVAASMDAPFFDPYGTQHALAVRSDGAAFAWGANNDGELGDGTVAERHAPVRVAGIGTAIAVAAGSQHSVAQLRDGSTVSWGANNRGQLGDGTTVARHTPVTTKGLRGATQLDAGDDFTLGLASPQPLPPIPAAITYQGTKTYQGTRTSDGGLPVMTHLRTRKGNVLIAHVGARGTAALPTPAGWTLAVRGTLEPFVDAVFWRVAQADGAQTYSFSLGGASSGTAIITTYSGVSTVNAVAATSTAVSSGTVQTARSITTPVPNCYLLAVFTTDAGGMDAPEGYDEPWRRSFSPDGSASLVGTATDDPYAGPTGDVRLRTTEANAIDHLIALRPAGAKTK